MIFASEHDEQTMTHLGLSSKREVTRTSIRVRPAMAVEVREQGRYLGGRPPYGYRLGDAGPHPNKAHAAGAAVPLGSPPHGLSHSSAEPHKSAGLAAKPSQRTCGEWRIRA